MKPLWILILEVFWTILSPRPIVRFIVNTLPITQDSLILDTSCGSGGFLLHALDKVRKQANDYYKENTIGHYNYWHDFAEKNLFGIEINEQIARIAKMNMIIHGDGHTNIVSCDGLLPVDDIIITFILTILFTFWFSSSYKIFHKEIIY